MTHDEVIKDVIEIKNGNTMLLSDLMKKCGYMMGSILKKYKGILAKHNIEFDDFRQELNLFFIQGVYDFPLEHENFIAYMFNYMNNRTFNFLRENTNMISKCDSSKGSYEILSLNSTIKSNDDNLEIIDTIVDENTLNGEDDIITRLEIEKSHDTMKKILSKFISLYDVEFLFDVYGLNGNYTIQQICEKYSISLHDFIMYERLAILTLKTSEKLYDYYETLMDISSQSYSYTYSRFKYTRISSTEHLAIKSIYLKEKFEKLVQRQKSMLVLHKEIIAETKDSDLVRLLPR
jgi:hypothetical protein